MSDNYVERQIISLNHVVKVGNWYKSMEIHFLVSAIITWILRDFKYLIKMYLNSHRNMKLTYLVESI